MNLIPIKNIKIENRQRDIDFSHVQNLAKSIEVEGLLQPIVVNDISLKKPKLIAGGHRLEAFKLLKKENIPANSLIESLKEQGIVSKNKRLTKTELFRYELLENTKRKDLYWQDRAIAIANYHSMLKADALEDNLDWFQDQTAEILDMSKAYVGRFILLAKELKENPEGDIAKSKKLSEALSLLLKLKQSQASKKLTSIYKAQKKERQRQQELAKKETQEPTLDLELEEKQTNNINKPSITVQDIKDFYHLGDCLDIMPTLPKVDHIITDPVYGIDMDNLIEGSHKDLDSVRDEHEIKSNLETLEAFIPLARNTIKETGFMIMFYDLENHGLLCEWADKADWIRCRWPFHWCKPRGANRQPSYNFSKKVEHAMILRASSKACLVEQQTTNWLESNNPSTLHPFSKPFKVWATLIRAVSLPNQTILDPMAGQGSSLEVIKKLDRFPIGIEIKTEHRVVGIDYLTKNLGAIE